jgi:hypothetical protein
MLLTLSQLVLPSSSWSSFAFFRRQYHADNTSRTVQVLTTASPMGSLLKGGDWDVCKYSPHAQITERCLRVPDCANIVYKTSHFKGASL